MLRSAFARSPLPPPGAPPSSLPVADHGSFDRVVLAGEEDCVALFGAAWCRACWRAGERLARLADRGSFAALAIDVEASPELARRYLVTGIPTILHFRNGQDVGRRIGEMGDDDLDHWLAVSGLHKRQAER
jgi:thioredoxin-like negative regulator of GroEL